MWKLIQHDVWFLISSFCCCNVWLCVFNVLTWIYITSSWTTLLFVLVTISAWWMRIPTRVLITQVENMLSFFFVLFSVVCCLTVTFWLLQKLGRKSLLCDKSVIPVALLEFIQWNQSFIRLLTQRRKPFINILEPVTRLCVLIRVVFVSPSMQEDGFRKPLHPDLSRLGKKWWCQRNLNSLLNLYNWCSACILCFGTGSSQGLFARAPEPCQERNLHTLQISWTLH